MRARITGATATPAALPARVATLLLTALTTVLALLPLGAAEPAAARSRAMPGSFTGYAFDACDAPSQRQMNAWRRHSKYSGVGIYIAGMNRACEGQPHLTRRWVSRQTRHGWRLLPIVVGRQASCSPAGYYVGKRISARRAGGYAVARGQGRRAARSAVRAAAHLGIARHSVLWFDLEHFDSSRTRCRRSALSFISGWTRQLHAQRYRSGLYSSASSGITALEGARVLAPGVYALPDYIWIAEWNGAETVRSAYLPAKGWWPSRRVHQYRGGHRERHGGVALDVDSNFMRTGRGTLAGRAHRPCGMRIGYGAYDRLERGAHGRRVRAAQCLLRQQHAFRGGLTGHYGRGTARAVRSLQRHRDLGNRPSGVLDRRTWTSLLSRGPTPLTKFGSGGNEVRRLQRSLNAATRASLRVDGVFAGAEMRVVGRYQRQVGLPRTGVVTRRTWRALQRGRVAPKVTAAHRVGLRLSARLPGLLSSPDDGALVGRGGVEHSIGAAGPG